MVNGLGVDKRSKRFKRETILWWFDIFIAIVVFAPFVAIYSSTRQFFREEFI